MIVPPPLRAIASPHRQMLEAAFGATATNPAWRAPVRPLVVLCFTNRCGSNYLAQLLASTGAFNEAGEFFNADTVLHHAERRNLRSLHDYVTALPELVPARPFLAAKAGADQLVMLADAGIITAQTPFVLLERQNRLAQAISRVIASQNRRWTTAHDTGVADETLIYDADAIAGELAKIERANAAFYSLFAANGIVPVHITYEALRDDPQTVIDRVAARVGAPGLKMDKTQITIRRQSNEINTRWMGRFTEERKEAFLF